MSHLQDGFWLVHIPFVRIAKFKFLAQFPIDHPSNSIVSGLILFLSLFAAFAYYVSNHFVYIAT